MQYNTAASLASNSPGGRRKPLFFGCLPLRKGNYVLMLLMILRSVCFILAAMNIFQAYLNVVSSPTVRLLFVLIAGCDFAFGSLGFYATKAKSVPYLRLH